MTRRRRPIVPENVPDYPLIGPLVYFRGRKLQIPVRHSPPQNTLDPRYRACTDHHLACDCREAEQQESLTEYRLQLREIDQVIAGLIEGHPTSVYIDDVNRRDLECQCGGCKVARITQRGLSWSSSVRDIKLKGTRW